MFNRNTFLQPSAVEVAQPKYTVEPASRNLFRWSICGLEVPDSVLVITLLGLTLRLIVLFIVRHNAPFADETDYQEIALSMIQKHQIILKGWTSAFRPMGEPIVISAVYLLIGQHLLGVKVLQEILLTCLPFLCWYLAQTIGLGQLQANVVAMLVAVNPALAYATATVYPTALTTLFLCMGIVIAGRAERLQSLKNALLSAFSLGLCGLFTTIFVPLPLLISLNFLWKRQVRFAIVFLTLGLLPSTAWVIRNKIVMHQWTLATNGGMNLYLGANNEATPRSGNWVTEPPVAGGEMERDRVLGARAKNWIRSHKTRWVELWLARGILVADSVGKPKTGGVHSGAAARVIGWMMFPLTVTGIVGLVLYHKNSEVLYTSAALALVVLSSATTIVKPRFRFPCDPLLTVTAVGTLFAAWQGVRGKILFVATDKDFSNIAN